MVRTNPGRRKFGRYGEAFPRCASIEAIDSYLKQAEGRRRTVEREIAWLTELRERRQQQIADGTWPTRKANVLDALAIDGGAE